MSPPMGRTDKPSAPSAWHVQRERSHVWAIRLLVALALGLGRPVARALLWPISLYFLCFAPTARRASVHYLQRVLGRPPAWREVFRHFHTFAAVALDRIWLVKGKTKGFDLHIEGGEETRPVRESGEGIYLLGAHLGSFEALRALGMEGAARPVAMVMYPENARKIQAILEALSPDAPLNVIAIGSRGSTLQIRDWLDEGGLVGILGDRHLPSETANSRLAPRQLAFLGQEVAFSDGPLRLALLLKRQVFFMAGLYEGGRRYRLCFKRLADFREPPADLHAREALIDQALVSYVSLLESLCRQHPFNWFNFYDYWQDESEAA
jgi:predicted LPLAT superfamily acyltransferase